MTNENVKTPPSALAPGDDLGRFRELLDAYGADSARWPEHARTWAEPLAASDGAARDLQHQAAKLDALLDELPAPNPAPELMADILAAAPASRKGPGRWALRLWPFGPIWQPIGTLVTATALGIIIGATVLGPASDNSDITDIDQLAFGDSTSLEIE